VSFESIVSKVLDIKEINRLAFPAIVYNTVEPIIGLADTAIIGQLPEKATEAQGGVGMAVLLMSLLVWGLAQTRTAVSSMVGRYFGMNKLDEIKPLIPQMLIFAVLLGVFFWILTDVFYTPIINFIYGVSDPSRLAFSQDYFHVRSMSLPLILLVQGVFGIFRGYQNTMWAMIISLTGGVLNIVLDLTLVNGVGDLIPAYGVVGAAWASVISVALMAIMCVWFLLKKTPFNLNLSFVPNKELKKTLLIAFNMLIRTLALNIAFLLAMRFSNGYGKVTHAAYVIGGNIWLFCSFFIDGYSNAGSAIAGKLLGTQDKGQLRWLGWKLMRINLIITTGLGLVFLVLYPFVGPLFSKDVAVQEEFFSFFWIVLVALPINCIAFSFDGIFKGLGEAEYLRNTLLIGTFLIFVPVIYTFDYYGFEIFSVWIAFVAWMMFRAGSLVWKFKRIVA